MMKLIARLHKEESGAVALLMALFLGILLVVTTTYAVHLNVSELSQSSQVDRSDESYYAAEAGIEDAVYKLDQNPNLPLQQVFPQQYSGSTLVGDMAGLTDSNGNWLKPLNIQTEDNGAHNEWQLAWRQRKVYTNDVSPSGDQKKDESIQLDVSQLERNVPGQSTCGTDPNDTDCDGNPVFSHFTALQYCWTTTANPTSSTPDIEITAVSWAASNISNIQTEKVIVKNPGSQSSPTLTYVTATGTAQGYNYCTTITVNQGRRYIFRIKPLFNGVGNYADTNGTQDAYSVNYKVILQDNTAWDTSYPLFIPNDSILIDVVGQDGDIRRRIVAKKYRNGRIYSIFDYVLYQGDKLVPLCKAGVTQSDATYSPNCLATPANNQ